MKPGADLTLPGHARIVAGFLAALDLREVTLVHSDWGGALFLTARGLGAAVAREIGAFLTATGAADQEGW
jgi:hypothetical protein